MFSEYSRILIASILAAAFLHSIRNKENSSSALESPGFNVGHSRAFFMKAFAITSVSPYLSSE
jgi:hypothetical protein